MVRLLYIYRWGGQSEYVFQSLQQDFMKPRINEVKQNNLLI